ncbi:hypothetical protein AB0L57_30080 [Nocardia sp. NPDC052254]|uniref:hypothetical protein n=1 Tax=Nocardia sp. NPDC052254 TaxID=3155681 RepID=UPI00343F4DAB
MSSLNMGEPDEVIAASHHVAATKLSFIDQVGAVTGGWAIDESPRSELDHQLRAKIFDKVGDLFDVAAVDYAEHTRTTDGRATDTASALHTVDVDGREQVRRSQSA